MTGNVLTFMSLRNTSIFLCRADFKIIGLFSGFCRDFRIKLMIPFVCSPSDFIVNICLYAIADLISYEIGGAVTVVRDH